MICLRSFKFELMPSGKQAHLMRCFAGARRFVFNKALELQIERHGRGEKPLSYIALCKQLTAWRSPETAWLAEAPIHPLQQGLKDLGRAFENFFEGRAGFPTFKRKGRGDSFRYPDSGQIELDQGNRRIKLPKLGWIRYRKSREVLGEVRNATVLCHQDRWYVSIQTRRDLEVPVHPGGAVGIDRGITRFASLSDGTHLEPRNSFRRHEEALAKAQRQMSHKVKFSRNWRKAKVRVQKLHSRIARVRSDFLHQATAVISGNPSVGGHGRSAGGQPVQVRGGHDRCTRPKCSSQAWLEQGHPRSGLVRVPAADGPRLPARAGA